MPFYEYRCGACRETFEILRPIAERDEPAACPKCGEVSAERELTVFAAMTAGSPADSCPSRSSCELSGGG
jgi:putative FmdB family regulatory protein